MYYCLAIPHTISWPIITYLNISLDLSVVPKLLTQFRILQYSFFGEESITKRAHGRILDKFYEHTFNILRNAWTVEICRTIFAANIVVCNNDAIILVRVCSALYAI